MKVKDIKRLKAKDLLTDVDNFKEILYQDGLVIVSDLNNKISLDMAKHLGEIFFHTDSDKEGIVHLSVITEDKKGENIRGFTSKELFPHTDRAVERFPPDIIMLWCNYPAEEGGESILVDGKDVCSYLLHNHREIFTKLLEKNSAIFCSEGRYHHGEIIESVSQERYAIRFRNDDLGFFSGDILDAIRVFKQTVGQFSQKIKLNAGEGYIAMNTRWLHGRTTINGPRSFGRIHINLPTEYGTLHRGFTLE